MGIGEWRESEAGARFVRRGTELDEVAVLYAGRVSVLHEGREVITLVPGQLVGDSLLYADLPETFEFIACQPVRWVAWTRGRLKELTEEAPRLRTALDALICRDIARKLFQIGIERA